MTKRAQVSIQIDGVRALQRALKALEDPTAPFLQAAMREVGPAFAGEVRSRAMGSIGGTIEVLPVKGIGAALRAPIAVHHPAGASKEFGRRLYLPPGSLKGNNQPGSKRRKGAMKGKTRTQGVPHAPGYRSQPYIGVVTGQHAVAAVLPRAKELIATAMRREFERIAAQGDGA